MHCGRSWQRLRQIAAALVVTLLACPVAAAPEVVLAPGQHRLQIDTLAEAGMLTGGSCALADGAFAPFGLPGADAAASALSNDAYWLRIRLANPEPTAAHLVVSLPYPPLDEITLHVVRDGPPVWTVHHGFQQHLGEAMLPTPHPAFPVELAPGETALVYLCIRSSGFVATPIWLMREAVFWRATQTDALVLGLLLGIVGATFAFAAALAALLRRPEFFGYMAFAATSAIYVVVSSGFARLWLGADLAFHVDAKTSLILSGAPVLISAVWLLRPLLRVPEVDPGADRILRGVMVAAALAMLSPWMPPGIALPVQGLAWGIAPLVVLMVLGRLWWAGARHATTILLGWGIGLIAAVYLYLRSIGAVPSHAIEPLLGPLVCTAAALCFAHALAETLRETEWKAQTDPLTGLWNRSWLASRAQAELARCRRRGATLSVGVFDADFFKHINDRWGHAIGDAVLRELAKQARASLRPGDQVARIGGEEFCILFPGLAATEAATALDRVRAAIETCGVGPLPAGALTISGGVAESLAGSVPFDALMSAADAALYAAKAGGRNRVEIAAPAAVAAEPRVSRRQAADPAPEAVLVGSD